jgi:hypothetical protein
MALVTLDFEDLYTAVADYLGFGTSPTGDSLALAKECAVDGYMRFIMGQYVDENNQMRSGYRWSFLTPSATLSLSDGDGDVDLPSGFGGMLEPFIHTDYEGRLILHDVPASYIRAKWTATDDMESVPTHFAIEPKTFSGSTQQSYQALFYPIPDGDYTLRYRFHITPIEPTGDDDFLLGGGQHRETIKACAKAVAQERRPIGGIDWQAKSDRLMAASVMMDCRNKPNILGNWDRTRLPVQRIRDTVTFS